MNLKPLALLLLAAFPAPAATYYVDSLDGNDAHSGLSETAAWKTLAKVNAWTFQPGDTLLFKAGGSWTGQLNPKGSGATNNPIVINQYGAGPKPLINGNGATGFGAVYLFNQQYWEINNLEVINDAAEGGDRRGIYLSASNFPGGIVRHLQVRDCHIHHIKGLVDQTSSAAKRTGGIIVETIEDRQVPTRFDDILIENCVIATVDNQGLALNHRVSVSDYPGTPAWEARKFTRVVIRGNSISDVAKNAMIIRLTDETGLIEHNVCYDTAVRAVTGNTIFSRSCRGTVFQFNEGYLNRSSDFDGSLYDADLQSPGCIFQYSYSHDNSHGLYWQCTDAADTNVIVRYNLSRNDRGIIFCMNYDCASTYVYNNTVFVPADLSPRIIDERRSGAKTYFFYNNLIYSLSPTAAYRWYNGNRTFDYNVFYGHHPDGEPADPHKLTADPLLVAPGSGGIGRSTLAGYQLQPGSPCIDSGKTVPGNGGRDFWGNPVPFNSATDRGAHEWQGPASNQPPVIREPPASQSAVQGATVAFEVIASGAPPLAYQWRKAGRTIPEATQATLTLSNVTTNDAAAYDVVITNAFGAVTSATATLTVALPPPPSLTLAAAAWATIRDGANATVNQDEQALGYAMVKYSTAGLSAKTYLAFDLAGSRPDPDRPALLTLQGFSNSGMQHLRLWALDQPCPEMSPDLVWITAPANETNSNDLLTSGPRTATPILDTLLPGGPVTHTLTLPAPWDQWIQNQTLVLVLTGVDNPSNAPAGFRIAVTNQAQLPSLTFSTLPLPPPTLKTPLRRQDGALELLFLSPAGESFSIFATTNLAFPAWMWLGTPVFLGNDLYQFTDLDAANHPRRFYRLASQ